MSLSFFSSFSLKAYDLEDKNPRTRFFQGFTLTEDPAHPYKANLGEGASLTPAQEAILKAKELGSNHIILTPRAIMLGPNTNIVTPVTKRGINRKREQEGYRTLIEFIHQQDMTVGIRPIFFVVSDLNSLGPYYETYQDENGQTQRRLRWHGNITPTDPEAWFESFQSYLSIYLRIASENKVEAFTIGAELYSMTVGIEDFWKEHPHGFPRNWLQILSNARDVLGNETTLMYDVNFTDDSNQNSDGELRVAGGELERWRYRLVDLAPDTLEERTRERRDDDSGWHYLRDFWMNLDMVGIDMYRSLASSKDVVSDDYSTLVYFLSERAGMYGDQLDDFANQIKTTLRGHHKNYIFKELGYRSSTKGFINPFEWDNRDEEVNILHQSAAYQAFFEGIWASQLDWFKGAVFWDLSINQHRWGAEDPGFCPIGKKETEHVIRTFFNE